MSLKSFDKFCENLILGEPSSEKAIYDERQNQLRQRYTIEALCVFGVGALLNTMVMEVGLQWSESYVMPMVLLAALSYLYWVIRNAVKGTLFGINGTKAVEYSGGVCMAMGIMYSFILFPDSTEEWSTFVISNGMVSEDLLMIIALVLYFGSGLAVVIAANIFKKNQQKNSAE